MTESLEAGIRPYRLEFVRESTEGVTPDNPSWQYYSDRARTVEPVLNPQAAAQMGLGEVDPENHLTATEQHQFTVSYDLQQWFTDGSGNAQDAAYDAIQRDADNGIPNSHTIVRRIDQSGIAAGNTVNGSNSKDTRQYYVAKGAKANATIAGDPSNADPDLVTLSYEAEKGRLYQIDQPEDAALEISSSDSSDTNVDVNIEGTDTNDTSVTETITTDSTDGTTTVTGTTTFRTIDAIELGSETTGNISVSESGSDQLAIIYGAAAYDHGEGDLGVPTTGTGSHASAIGSAYAIFHNDTVKDGAGNAVADNIVSVEASVSNEFETPARDSGPRRTIVATNRVAELANTVYGETEHYQNTVDSVRSIGDHVDWTYIDTSGSTLGTLRFADAQATEVSATEEAGQGVKETEITLQSQGVVIDP